MSSLTQIKDWTRRYHFNEPEIEILLRCINTITKESDEESDEESSFINILAHSSPHAFFFLPCDELKKRTGLCEKILPTGFEKRFKNFVLSSNHKTAANVEIVENFLNSISLCCRRGKLEALKVIFYCASDKDQPKPRDLIDLCYKLSIAAQTMAIPNDYHEPISRLKGDPLGCQLLGKSLLQAADDNGFVDQITFTDWALNMVPEIGSTMETFVQTLLFHGILKYERPAERFLIPTLENTSDFFKTADPSLLFLFRCMSRDLLGKVRCID